MSNINNQHQATIKADLGGGGGLRGSTAVPRPLPAPSPPLMPSGAQGVSASTGGGAHRGGGLPGTSTSTPLTPPTPPTPTPTPPTPPTSSPSIPLTLPVPSPPLIPSVVQGGSASRGGGTLGGEDLPGFSSNLISFLQPSFLTNCPTQLPSSPPPIRPPPPPSSSPPLPSTGDSKPLGVPGASLLPLKGCPNPHFCLGGRNHVHFLPPGRGGDMPTREQVEWVTLR